MITFEEFQKETSEGYEQSLAKAQAVPGDLGLKLAVALNTYLLALVAALAPAEEAQQVVQMAVHAAKELVAEKEGRKQESVGN